MKRIILFSSMGLVALVLVVGALVLHSGMVGTSAPPHGGSGPAIQLPGGSESIMRCEQHTCSLAVTNLGNSPHAIAWHITRTAPPAETISAMSGTIQPGETAHIQIVFPATSTCPYTISASWASVNENMPPPTDFTWHCGM